MNVCPSRFFDVEHVRIGPRPGEPGLRWIQPPQVAYFVCTMNGAGQRNVTPVTMGTAMASPRDGWWYNFAVFEDRDTHAFLQEVPECVISYYGWELRRASWIAALPIPRGIDETLVAGLHPLPSHRVRPAGVAECPINLECRVELVHRLGAEGSGYMYLCKVLGLHVHAELFKQEEAAKLQTGLLAIDPLLECLIQSDPDRPGSPARLHYVRLDRSQIYRDADDLGSASTWIGGFAGWMADEVKRGRITEDEADELRALEFKWTQNPDPATNGELQAALTAKLAEVVQRVLVSADKH